jgi:hypothetical protein
MEKSAGSCLMHLDATERYVHQTFVMPAIISACVLAAVPTWCSFLDVC